MRPYRREENILFESTRSEKVISLLLESRSILQHLCIFLEMFQTMQHYQLTFISLRGRGQGKRDATPRNWRVYIASRLGRMMSSVSADKTGRLRVSFSTTLTSRHLILIPSHF